MDDTHSFDPAILDDLIAELSNVASVYHKPADTFVKYRKPGSHLKKPKVRTPAAEPEVEVPPVETLNIS